MNSTPLYQVLIVDDHPMITQSYENAFHEVAGNHAYKFQLHIAHSFQEVQYQLEHYYTVNTLDLIIIDLKLPAYPKMGWYSGEEFATYIKKELPDTKIIIATMFSNHFKIQNLFKKVNPDGFLTKSELTPEIMNACITDVIEGGPYYSKQVISSLRKNLVNPIDLDNTDVQLLYQLSIGTMTKDLPQKLFLSLASVERRKKRLREVFDIATQKSDQALILKAKELGFI